MVRGDPFFRRRTKRTVAVLKRIAGSTAAGVWRIKRAKIILALFAGRSVDEMVMAVRVPPESVARCREGFAKMGVKYFARPDRGPTPREARVERMLAFLDDPPGPRHHDWSRLTVHYIGREYSAREVAALRRHIASHPEVTRGQLAEYLCKMFNLYQSNEKPKMTSAAHVIRRMAMDNIVHLPETPPRRYKRRRAKETIRVPAGELVLAHEDIPYLYFVPVTTARESELWRDVIERFHYIDGFRLFGSQIRYLVYGSGSGEEPTIGKHTAIELPVKAHLLGALAFGASAWRLKCRDEFVGWTARQRERNLNLVVNNARFLILPWIRSPNLASRILGRVVRRLPEDWGRRYHFVPAMLETFVQLDRHTGTCYRAANWIPIGTTSGYSLHWKQKRDAPRKAVYVYPLRKDFRRILCSGPG